MRLTRLEPPHTAHAAGELFVLFVFLVIRNALCIGGAAKPAVPAISTVVPSQTATLTAKRGRFDSTPLEFRLRTRMHSTTRRRT